MVPAMGRQRTILVLAIASQAAYSLISFGLPAIALEIRDRLDVGVAGFGAVYAAVSLGSAIALIPAGMLVDRLGAREVLVIGGVVNGLGTLVAAWQTNAYAFSAALLVAGIGGAAVPVAGMSSLMRAFAPEKRGSVMGWRQLAVPLGGTIGAIMLPLLTDSGGVPLAMIVCAVAVTTTSVAFGLLVDHPRADGAVVEGRTGLRAVFRVPGIKPALTVAFVYIIGLTAVLTYYIPAVRAEGLTRSQAAIGFTLVNIVAGISRPVWGRLADRGGGTRRTRTLRETGIVGAAAAILMLPALHAGVVAALAVTAVLAFGVFGFNGLVYLLVGELGGSARSGVAVGVASTVIFGAGAIIAPVAGLAVENLGYGALWAMTAAAGAAGAAIAWRWLPRPARAASAGGALVARAPGCPNP
jgi:MFS family permease